MVLWGKASNSLCKFCLDTQTLQHVVSGCKTALYELRYNWRHDSIIANVMKELKNLANKQLALYADIAGYKSPAKSLDHHNDPTLLLLT